MQNKEMIVQPVGFFFAITYDNQVYRFIVNNNGTMYCNDLLENKAITKLIIKPNFEIIHEDGISNYRELTNQYKDAKNLIGSYCMTKELNEYLIEENLISYSTDMAYLYDLNPSYARDANEQSRAFKYQKSNSKRLAKQKQGIFN